ncbi:MAG: Clp protease/crotonase-like domain-containing protein [Planctomycetota bacterium]|jgi:hypothetical protein
MKLTIKQLLALCLTLLVTTAIASAQSVEVRTKSGVRWRGDLNDSVVVTVMEQGVAVEYEGRLIEAKPYYIIIEGRIAGQVHKKTIFRGDIRTMRGAAATETAEPARTPRGANSRPERPVDDSVPTDDLGRELGVFVLPLEGPVGEIIRHEEIEMVAAEADKYGRGQIIVLVINTNGGLVSESVLIDETLQEVKKRHRVVAWIQKAVSAGAAIAMMCDEIYFMTEGIAGSVTTVRGTSSLSEEEAIPHVQQLVDIATRNGYSEHIARAMKLNKYMCSYDKDPETGEVTFYGDLSGEFDLSDGESNLNFNSSRALHCGFSKGTADTEEDFAKLLDLPKWHEVSDYGRQIAKDWQDTAERAKERIQRLIARRDYYKTGGTGAEERIGALIKINRELLQWWDRAPNVARMMLPGDNPTDGKYLLEREIEELRRQLAALRRN